MIDNSAFICGADRAQRICEAVVSGLVWGNWFFVRDLGQAFGGARNSGIGCEGGQWRFDFYCELKTVTNKIGTFA